jgi:GH25 family lysozyme M1 (1,4-beta-N-acetylmuramidase)
MSTPPTPLVLDLSHHNTVESLKPAAAAGVIGVVHKATQGVGMVDEKYLARRFLAREAGLLWGAYHYLTATSVDLQVAHFLSTVKEGDTYPFLVLDFEERGVSLTVAASFVRLVQQETGSLPRPLRRGLPERPTRQRHHSAPCPHLLPPLARPVLLRPHPSARLARSVALAVQ